jgi:hypothetical protein
MIGRALSDCEKKPKQQTTRFLRQQKVENGVLQQLHESGLSIL